MGATRLASGMNAKAHKTVLIIRLSVSLYLMYKHGIFPDARRVALSLQQLSGAAANLQTLLNRTL